MGFTKWVVWLGHLLIQEPRHIKMAVKVYLRTMKTEFVLD